MKHPNRPPLAPSDGPHFENPPLIHNNFDGGFFIYFWFAENEQARSRRFQGNEYLPWCYTRAASFNIPGSLSLGWNGKILAMRCGIRVRQTSKSVQLSMNDAFDTSFQPRWTIVDSKILRKTDQKMAPCYGTMTISMDGFGEWFLVVRSLPHLLINIMLDFSFQ